MFVHTALAMRFRQEAVEVLKGQPIHLYSQDSDEPEWPADVNGHDLAEKVLMHAYAMAIADAFRARNFKVAMALIANAVDPNGDAAPFWPGWMYTTLKETAGEAWLDENLPGWRFTGEIGS